MNLSKYSTGASTNNDEGPSQRNNKLPLKRGAPLEGVSSQKRRMRDDNSDEESFVPSAIRRATATSAAAANAMSILESVTDENAKDEIERKIKDVVRLAVFTSHSDASLKREDIRSVVGNMTPRMVEAIFQKAQQRLRDVFGMELVELTTRGRNGTNAEKGVKAYYLCNILPMQLISTDVIDWKDQVEDMGLLMVILSLVMIREGAIYEKQSVPGNIQTKLDGYVKQKYLEKIKLEHMDDSGEKPEMEIRWGARARVEVPEENVVQFIKEVFGKDAPPGLEASIMKAAGMKGNEDASQQAQ
ncbi:Melanoma-associated antigen D2 [Podila epigama]|nr:Melanoma-associated antigen D2 [Podila epigama]